MSSSQSDKPLGLIAGSGALPLQVAKAQNGAVFVVALEGEADETLLQYPHIVSPIGCMKAAADALLDAGCADMVIIGGIQRPNIEKLELMKAGIGFLSRLCRAPMKATTNC